MHGATMEIINGNICCDRTVLKLTVWNIV